MYKSDGGMEMKDLYYEMKSAYSTVVFNPGRNFYNNNSNDEIVPMYDQIIPCGLNYVDSIKVSFECMSRGWYGT